MPLSFCMRPASCPWPSCVALSGSVDCGWRRRPQAECEELGGKVDTLAGDNSSLRLELQRLKDLCETLRADKAALEAGLLRILNPALFGQPAPAST